MPDSSNGIFFTLRHTLEDAATALKTRLALFANEAAAARLLLLDALVRGMLAAFLLGSALTFFVFFLMRLLPDEALLVALGLGAGGFFLAAFFLLRTTRAGLSRYAPFAASLDELRQDIEALRSASANAHAEHESAPH
ncbi:MAG: phage holin family protein [Zoogloeaceae bacterium]|jgi:uncharacterized membrane protein YqjE|nr:phage holin family protein [Zoogloeaceae bacterium]